MSDLSWGNIVVGRVAVHKIAVFISLGLVAIFIFSCGDSSDKDAGAGAGTGGASYSPVVFMADKDTNGTIELYASFDDGIDIIKLSETMTAGGNVEDFRVSPDGIWVAYVADQDRNDVFELYVVPVDKASDESAVKVSGTFMAGDGVKETATGRYAFEWAGDTSRIAYLADQTTAGVVELYSNVPEGTSLFRLSVLQGTQRDVEDFAWSPDLNNFRLIAYRADEQSLGVIELWTTTPTSEASQKVSDGLGSGRNVRGFKWAPDARRIAFIADKIQDRFRLYTTLPQSSKDQIVSGFLDATSDVINFQWSPNGDRLAYLADFSTGDDFQLLTTPNDRDDSRFISRSIPDEDNENNYGWSADSSLVAFIADRDTDDVFELYVSDPLASSPVIKVSEDFATGNDGDVTAFGWAPTELMIAYTADQDTNDKFELYTTEPSDPTNPPLSATVEKVSGDDFAGIGVEDDFQWSSDSSLIAYRADQDTLNKIELYTADPDGLVNNKVSEIQPIEGDVDEFKWDDSGEAVGYLADQDSNNIIELYASLPDGEENTNFSGELVTGGDVFQFEWVP